MGRELGSQRTGEGAAPGGGPPPHADGGAAQSGPAAQPGGGRNAQAARHGRLLVQHLLGKRYCMGLLNWLVHIIFCTVTLGANE